MVAFLTAGFSVVLVAFLLGAFFVVAFFVALVDADLVDDFGVADFFGASSVALMRLTFVLSFSATINSPKLNSLLVADCQVQYSVFVFGAQGLEGWSSH